MEFIRCAADDPECGRHQADGLSHRRELRVDGSADRGRQARQGSDRRGRVDGALRRGGEHQLGRAARARGRAGGLRRVRPEDARQALAADPPRKRPPRRVASRPLRASGNGQLSSAHHPPLHGLRPADRGPGHLRRRERGLPAHHEPCARRAHEAAAAGAVHDAPPRAGVDPARDPQCQGGQARADRRQDERAGGGGRDPRALRGIQRRREGRTDRPRRVFAAARRAGHVREHSRAFDPRPLPRTPPRLVFRERRRCGRLAGFGRLDGPQPVPPGRSRLSRARSGPAQARRRRGIACLSRRQCRRVGAACGRQVVQGEAAARSKARSAQSALLAKMRAPDGD